MLRCRSLRPSGWPATPASGAHRRPADLAVRDEVHAEMQPEWETLELSAEGGRGDIWQPLLAAPMPGHIRLHLAGARRE